MSVFFNQKKRAVKNALLSAFTTALILSVALTSCQKDSLDTQSPAEISAKAGKAIEASQVTTTSTCFSAIAQVAACTRTEWIRFSGMIELKENVTTDANGKTHVTRHFTVKDLSGVGVNIGATLSAMACLGTLNGSLTGSTYDVLGGAEMFNIHFGEGGNATLGGSNTFAHRGTLVFVNRSTSQRVIAKHIIRKINGVVMKNTWECSGN